MIEDNNKPIRPAISCEETGMRLVHYFRPLLDLGSCKEYIMASKNGNTTRKTKKSAIAQTPVNVGVAGSNGSGTPINMEEQIRRRAYEIYLERGATPGAANEDWIVAEREVLARGTQAVTH
jgi:hypothetical protein